MTNKEIFEWQQKLRHFDETELGHLFNRFVNLHATAWQLDERSGDGYGELSAKKAWEKLEPVDKELRKRLMEIAGVTQDCEKEAKAYKWAYEYLQSRMESIDRHGWAHDCDSEIEFRIHGNTK